MQITVKFFASLRERLGKREICLETDISPLTITAVWESIWHEPLPSHILTAVNQVYVTHDAIVQAGDEVAFFPPVTGG